jgi:hypothetical protein
MATPPRGRALGEHRGPSGHRVRGHRASAHRGQGVAAVQGLIASWGWLVREQFKDDYGIDAHVPPVIALLRATLQ